MKRKSRITVLTKMNGIIVITGMPRMTRVAGMTGMTGGTRMT